MATKIDWCDETINPIIGCRKVSRGCKHCYAEKMASRLARMGCEGYAHGGDDQRIVSLGMWTGRAAFVPSALQKAYRWMKPRSIFVGSMGDLFLDSVPFEWIDQVMRLVWVKKDHTFIFLTKRPERMKEYFTGLATAGTQTATAQRLLDARNYMDDHHGWHMIYLKGGALPNLVLGVSAEHQEAIDERLPILAETPAARRFISVEPMVSPISLRWLAAWPNNAPTTAQRPGGTTDHLDGLRRIDGVIVGGESGTAEAKYLALGWVRTIRDQCAEAGVTFMFKQGSGENGNRTAGHWKEKRDGFPVLDGEIHTDLPWSVR